MLGVYGDYIASRNQTGRKAATEAAAELFSRNGGHGEVIDLVADHAVRGNSHIMMQGDNNDFIAGLIMDWLAQHAESTPVGRPGKPVAGGGKGGRMSGVFAALDLDGSGTLDAAEFGQGARYQHADRRTIREAFAAMDSDDDDSISADEFSSGLGRRGGGGGGKGKGKGKGR